jgi:hypothetical protein
MSRAPTKWVRMRANDLTPTQLKPPSPSRAVVPQTSQQVPFWISVTQRNCRFPGVKRKKVANRPSVMLYLWKKSTTQRNYLLNGHCSRWLSQVCRWLSLSSNNLFFCTGVLKRECFKLGKTLVRMLWFRYDQICQQQKSFDKLNFLGLAFPKNEALHQNAHKTERGE